MILKSVLRTALKRMQRWLEEEGGAAETEASAPFDNSYVWRRATSKVIDTEGNTEGRELRRRDSGRI
jgi:hypothetical protein